MIPDEAVEAAAVALARANVDRSWDDHLPARKDWYRERARAALEAASQLITGSAWDEGYGHGYKHGREDCMKLHEGLGGPTSEPTDA